jgi:hypothetical protein
MMAVPPPPGSRNLRDVANLLLQKLSAPRFSAVVRLTPNFAREGVRGGLVMMGSAYASLTVKKSGEKLSLLQTACPDARDGGQEIEIQTVEVPSGSLILKMDIADSAVCSFSFSTDGTSYAAVGKPFVAQGEAWIGAKVGLFCSSPEGEESGDWIDVDWFHIQPLR